MSKQTFTMIKPDAMKNGHAGAIIDRIIKEGFRIVAMKLTRLSAEKAGEFIGATNPAQAAEGTIRKLFATSVGENAVHGSDSDENAIIEGNFFFSNLERI